MHGLHSDSRHVWRSEASLVPGNVLASARRDDPTFESASVFLAGYYTDPDSTSFGMRDAGGSVRLQLVSSVEGHPPVIAKKNLLFVAHSLGGILTRDMLTRYTSDFIGKRIGLLLVASPSNGSAYADRLIPLNWVAKATWSKSSKSPALI